MSDKQQPKNAFVREQIKDKPKNYKRMWVRLGESAACGGVFALAVCLVLLFMIPVLRQEEGSVPDTGAQDSQQASVEETEQGSEEKEETQTPEERQPMTLDDYQQIQTEKQHLIAEKKIKKEKPLAEISEDEIPFDIPESWKWVRWGNLSFSIQYGYNAPAKQAGRIKMVRISDIQNGKVIWDSVPFCDIRDEDLSTYLLAENDILFARTGGTVGKSYIVKEIPEEAIYAGYLIRTRYSDMLCPEYLYYFMQTHLYWIQLRNGTIATAQPNCNGQTLSKMILPLPPLAEQKRIVAKIEELLPLCERLK